jgi:hypothetical protein
VGTSAATRDAGRQASQWPKTCGSWLSGSLRALRQIVQIRMLLVVISPEQAVQ